MCHNRHLALVDLTREEAERLGNLGNTEWPQWP
jgi:hypothetical protein